MARRSCRRPPGAGATLPGCRQRRRARRRRRRDCCSPTWTTTPRSTSSSRQRTRRSCSAVRRAASPRCHRSIALRTHAPSAIWTAKGRLDLVGLDSGRTARHREERRHEGLSLAARPAAAGDGARRPAHQLVRHRRRSRSPHAACTCSVPDRQPDRPHRARRGDEQRGRPDLLAERHHPVRVPAEGRRDHPRRSAPEGLVPVAVCVERPRDGVCHRPHLAIAARPAHQRAGDSRRSTTEDWVKVGGDQLVARDGAYDLRITAELWETHFFDLVALGVRRSSRGHRSVRGRALRRARAPARAGGHRSGAAIRARHRRPRARRRRRRRVARRPAPRFRRPRRLSGHHARPLHRARRARRGAARWPALPGRAGLGAPDRQLDERRDLAGRAGDAEWASPLQVADADGRFRSRASPALASRQARTRPCGFDLAGVCRRPGPRRLRLATNLEVFWDRLAWAAGRPDVRVAPRRCCRCVRPTCATVASR